MELNLVGLILFVARSTEDYRKYDFIFTQQVYKIEDKTSCYRL
jgi:hypothetical protein